MSYRKYKTCKHCRWCGQPYWASKPYDKDGFHSASCKQAHYRAYKKYVTATDGPQQQLRRRPGRKP